jgi:hypothetical chaperone protein
VSKAFGLDFGTTNSALAHASSDGSVRLAQFSGNTTFRSVLYFDEDETGASRKLRVVAGPDAIHSYLNAKTPGRLIQSTKSYLASRLFTQTQIFGETYSLEELIGILLRYLRKAAEASFGDLGRALVVGRPVHFSGAKHADDDEFAANRLRSAFRHAGFDEVHFLPEPVAAAYKYQRRLDHEELVLIADFGGGTSDFSLVQLKPGPLTRTESTNQILGTGGVGIAGDAFDSKLVRRLVAPMLGLGSEYKSQFGNILPVPNWLYEHLERWHYLSFLKTRKNLDLLRQIHFQSLAPKKISALLELVDDDLGYRLYQAVEQTKCQLSASAVSEIQFREAAIAIDDSVRRETFEGWIGRELQQITVCVDRLLAQCGVTAEDVDAIFMTGGSSFVPAIRRIFESTFGAKVPIRVGQEFTSVAEGLAIYALELFG